MTDTPAFVEGARVAVDEPNGYREAIVGKVYKNGNFVLSGDTQQWHPRGARADGVVVAWKTGAYTWVRSSVILWNDAADSMIRKALAEAKRQKRFSEVLHRIRNLNLNSVTDAMLDQFEAALGPKP